MDAFPPILRPVVQFINIKLDAWIRTNRDNNGSFDMATILEAWLMIKEE